ncbi:MAG: hypothetical protein JOZ72_16105 [Alphaproteobacteria bacterium]|nr:hypothetical protein [Alphaproteobacteria bacterium]
MDAPKSICVLADSHAAALRRGWSLIEEEFPGTALTFFAGTSGEWNSLRLDDGKLAPTSPILQEHFARSARKPAIADDYDAYLVCSIGLAISFALKQWLQQDRQDWPLHRAAVARHIRNTNCAHALALLRKITAKPVLLMAAPFQPQDYCLFSPSLDDETTTRIRTEFFEECEALAARNRATFFRQPKRTWAPNGVTTQMQFASLSLPDGRDDRRHCNPRYGALVLRRVLESGFGGD